MGVCGAGKTTVCTLLAARCAGTFIDADDLHPLANRDKMRAGTPLTDADRAPWLASVAEALAAGGRDGRPLFIACSALKRAYRRQLAAAAPAGAAPVVFVHLTGPRAALAARLQARANHYMPPSLLDSQLALCEPLVAGEETGFAVDVSPPPADVAEAAARGLRALDAAAAPAAP
jgi:gluconokinase